MKNKTKKILAGACLGLVGMGAMTGCAEQLSQDNIDKIMTIIENGDVFMEDMSTLIEDQNALLDKMVAESRTEEVDLLLQKIKIVSMKTMANYNNIGHNVIKRLEDNIDYFTYKTEDGVYVSGHVIKMNNSKSMSMILSKNSESYYVNGQISSNNTLNISSINKEESVVNHLAFLGLDDFELLEELDSENIVDYNISEDGSFDFTYYTENEDGSNNTITREMKKVYVDSQDRVTKVEHVACYSVKNGDQYVADNIEEWLLPRQEFEYGTLTMEKLNSDYFYQTIVDAVLEEFDIDTLFSINN
ncbi:MAG: hypothetical protein IJW59_00310 [Clostridia bacterium]|nr:hypothetical protein [Clostridia bacterium]